MQIHIQGAGTDLTPAMQEYIKEKIGTLDKFVARWETSGEIDAFVELHRTTAHHRHGDLFQVIVDIRVPKKLVRAEHTDEDARVAVDVVRDILKRELERYKAEHIASNRRTGREK